MIEASFIAPEPFRFLRYGKDTLKRLSIKGRKAWGRPDGGMLTDFKIDGSRVIFVHNPKTGGTSLGKFLGVKRRSHRYPNEVLSLKHWENSFSIVVVRHPFERFLSCFYTYILRPGSNGLTKRYGQTVKSFSPFELLELISQKPRYGGPQTAWTHYPSAIKPKADLILRFEEILTWKTQLLEIGLDVGLRTLLHSNQSERASSDHHSRLKLDNHDYQILRAAVMSFYRTDCLAFDYE